MDGMEGIRRLMPMRVEYRRTVLKERERERESLVKRKRKKQSRNRFIAFCYLSAYIVCLTASMFMKREKKKHKQKMLGVLVV